MRLQKLEALDPEERSTLAAKLGDLERNQGGCWLNLKINAGIPVQIHGVKT